MGDFPGSVFGSASVFSSVLDGDLAYVHMTDDVPVDRHILADDESAVVGKRESVEGPGYLRRRCSGSTAFERHWRTWLKCLLYEAVQKSWRSV